MSWLQHQSVAEWVLFIGTFLAVAIWETLAPGREAEFPVGRRWGGHALLFAVSSVVSGVLLRITGVALAVAVSRSWWGILNREWMPFGLRCLIAVILLDLVRYATHRLFHSVAILWRVHEIHHSDPDYDVSTAGRFHPIEVLVDQAVFLVAIALLAPPAVAVFASELITTGVNLFEHANACLPSGVERLLRLVFITPDIHRLHHSVDIEDQSRNFGQTFCWWDRLFRTWRGTPSGWSGPTGIKELREGKTLGVGYMLREPFRSRGESRPD